MDKEDKLDNSQNNTNIVYALLAKAESYEHKGRFNYRLRWKPSYITFPTLLSSYTAC